MNSDVRVQKVIGFLQQIQLKSKDFCGLELFYYKARHPVFTICIFSKDFCTNSILCVFQKSYSYLHHGGGQLRKGRALLRPAGRAQDAGR